MAAEYLANAVQEVAINSPVVLNASIPCTRGFIYHEDETGVFILRGVCANTCNQYAHYQVTFNANIAVPEGGTAAPIAVAIATSGEPRMTSRAIYTPAAAGDYGNVTSTAIIKVPRGCCYSLSVDCVAAEAGTEITAIDVQNANLTIARIA